MSFHFRATTWWISKRQEWWILLTCSHEFIDFGWASLGLFHAVTFLQEVIDLREIDSRVWRHAIGGDFPKQHPECCKEVDQNISKWKNELQERNNFIWMYTHVLLTPDIRLDWEGVVCEALWCSPFDGELGPSVSRVSITRHQPAQAKVCNLHNVILPDQTVPRCEIPEGGKVRRREGEKGGEREN